MRGRTGRGSSNLFQLDSRISDVVEALLRVPLQTPSKQISYLLRRTLGQRAPVRLAPEDCGERPIISPQGPAPVTGVFPAGDFLPLLETGIQAIQLSPYHAGPATRQL